MSELPRYIAWSGGKDSTASIIVCHENGIKVDGVVMSEVMFDHSRNISGENPRHIQWVYNVAIPIIEKVFGYKVIVLSRSFPIHIPPINQPLFLPIRSLCFDLTPTL